MCSSRLRGRISGVFVLVSGSQMAISWFGPKASQAFAVCLCRMEKFHCRPGALARQPVSPGGQFVNECQIAVRSHRCKENLELGCAAMIWTNKHQEVAVPFVYLLL